MPTDATILRQAFVPQAFVPQAFVPQAFVPQAFVPQAFVPQAFVPHDVTTYRPMPLTYFAHQVFVLPFKWAFPRYVDGTALCIGSMAPDFAYAFVGTPLFFASHTPSSLVTWTLPVTYVLTRLTRGYFAEDVGAQLPDPVGTEVRALAHSAHRWPITVLSALLGGWSHIFVDGFTHRHGWGYEHFEVLRRPVAPDWVVAEVLQYVGHTLGTLLGVLMFWRLCVSHRVSVWNGSYRVARRSRVEVSSQFPWFRPAVGWGAAVCGLGILAWVFLGATLPVAIIRASYLALGFLCVIVFSTRRARSVSTCSEERLD